MTTDEDLHTDDQTQLPDEHEDRKDTRATAPLATISGELLPLALEVYKDLMLNGKNEKVKLEAANAVVEIEGLKNRQVPHLGVTLNVPPEYLMKSLKALGTMKLAPRVEADDI